MKDNERQKNRVKFGLAISLALNVGTLVAMIFVIYNVSRLNSETDSLNRQLLQFNGRTNNLEGCWQHQDYACPENKYVDSRQFVK